MTVYGGEQSQTVTLLKLSGLNTGLKCRTLRFTSFVDFFFLNF